MSKGRWKKGKVQPRIVLYCKVIRTLKAHKCSKCSEQIQAGSYCARLMPPFKGRHFRYWNLHIDCLVPWIEWQLRMQAEVILQLRGYNPFDMPCVYAPSQGIKLGMLPKGYAPTPINQIPKL